MKNGIYLFFHEHNTKVFFFHQTIRLLAACHLDDLPFPSAHYNVIIKTSYEQRSSYLQ